jgi:hypothetical protein
MKKVYLCVFILILIVSACASDAQAEIPETTYSQHQIWLMEEMNVASWYKKTFDAPLPPETTMQTRILDRFYDFIFDEWFSSSESINRDEILLRDFNICVVKTEEFNNTYYSVIPVLKEGSALYLVKHTDPNNEAMEILEVISGHFSLSSGFMPNIYRSIEGDILWGELTPERLGIDPETGMFDILVHNDFSFIELSMKSESIQTFEITTPGVVLLFFENDHILACKMLNDDGEIHSGFTFIFDSNGDLIS